MDLQVAPAENLDAIEMALRGEGNNRVTIEVLPRLNHLFQASDSGAPSEYATIEETIAPSALTLIGDWVGEQVGAIRWIMTTVDVAPVSVERWVRGEERP